MLGRASGYMLEGSLKQLVMVPCVWARRPWLLVPRLLVAPPDSSRRTSLKRPAMA